MQQIWVAALAINLALIFSFLCCFRLFNLCIRYSTILQDFYRSGLNYVDDEHLPSPVNQPGHHSERYSRNSIAKQLKRVNKEVLAESRRLWLPRTRVAILALLCLVIDAAALSSFSFATTVSSDGSDKSNRWSSNVMDIMYSIARFIMLDIPGIPYKHMFFFCVSVAFFTLPLGIYILIKDRRDNSFPQMLFNVVGNIFIFPICCSIFNILSCDYQSSRPYVSIWTSLTCWQKTHSLMVALGLTSLVVYYVMCNLVMARMVRSVIDDSELVSREGQDAFYIRPSFVVAYFHFRMCASFLVSYWSDQQYNALVVIVGMTVALLFAISYNIYSRPCNVDIYNSLRTYSLTLPLALNLSSYFKLFIPQWDSNGKWVMLSGLCIWSIAVIVHFISEYGCSCTVFSPRRETYSGITDISSSVDAISFQHNARLQTATTPLPGAITLQEDSLDSLQYYHDLSTRRTLAIDAGEGYSDGYGDGQRDSYVYSDGRRRDGGEKRVRERDSIKTPLLSDREGGEGYYTYNYSHPAQSPTSPKYNSREGDRGRSGSGGCGVVKSDGSGNTYIDLSSTQTSQPPSPATSDVNSGDEKTKKSKKTDFFQSSTSSQSKTTQSSKNKSKSSKSSKASPEISLSTFNVYSKVSGKEGVRGQVQDKSGNQPCHGSIVADHSLSPTQNSSHDNNRTHKRSHSKSSISHDTDSTYSNLSLSPSHPDVTRSLPPSSPHNSVSSPYTPNLYPPSTQRDPSSQTYLPPSTAVKKTAKVGNTIVTYHDMG